MARSEPAPTDEERQLPVPPDPRVLAELQKEWERVMKIAETGDTDERVHVFSTFAEKRRALGVGPLPAPTWIIIREARDSDHGRLWPIV